MLRVVTCEHCGRRFVGDLPTPEDVAKADDPSGVFITCLGCKKPTWIPIQGLSRLPEPPPPP